MISNTDWDGPQWKHCSLTEEGRKERYDFILKNSVWVRIFEDKENQSYEPDYVI